MKTIIGPFTVETSSYDPIAELEKNPKTASYAKYLREKLEDAHKQASEYLKTKDRKLYYTVDLFSYVDGDDMDYSISHHFTDKEVARINELVAKVYNEEFADDGKKIKNAAELEGTDTILDDLKGLNSELDRLLFEPCEDDYLHLSYIHLDKPYNKYTFTVRGYNEEEEKAMPPQKCYVVLTDEEYIYLLTQQIADREGFTFNRLLLYKPALAQRISSSVDGCYSSNMTNNNMPYLIQLTEVREDVAKIMGPKDESIELYFENDHGKLYHVIANTTGKKLSVEWETEPGADYQSDGMSEINADSVQKHLGVNNYREMLEEMKRRFGVDKSCYFAIQEWFDKEGIKFKGLHIIA